MRSRGSLPVPSSCLDPTIDRSEERLSDVHVYGCSQSTHIYGYTYLDVSILPGRCTERPTTAFFDVYSWKLT